MRSHYWLLAVLCAAGLLACADGVAPDVESADSTGAATSLLSDSSTSLDGSSSSSAKIMSTWLDVRFKDRYVYGQAHMDYRGTNGEVTVTLNLRTATATVATTSNTKGDYGLPLQLHGLTNSVALSVPKSCGYFADVHAQFRASDSIFPIPGVPPASWGKVQESGFNQAFQPDCVPSCPTGGTGGTSSGDGLFDLAYDPYATFDVSCGGTTPPGGTQYFPGDHTNGETVDFHTGVGDGGRSVCGLTAVVRWVCIDIYDERTGQWEEYACGYATTC